MIAAPGISASVTACLLPKPLFSGALIGRRRKRRFVEIELGFDGERSVEHVHVLSRHMQQDLAAEEPGVHFRIVPVWEPEE